MQRMRPSEHQNLLHLILKVSVMRCGWSIRHKKTLFKFYILFWKVDTKRLYILYILKISIVRVSSRVDTKRKAKKLNYILFLLIFITF